MQKEDDKNPQYTRHNKNMNMRIEKKTVMQQTYHNHKHDDKRGEHILVHQTQQKHEQKENNRRDNSAKSQK